MLAPNFLRCGAKLALKSEWVLVLVAGEEVHVEEITAQCIGCKRKRIRINGFFTIGYIEYACANCVRSSVKRTLKSEWALVLVSGQEVYVKEITAQGIGCKFKQTH